MSGSSDRGNGLHALEQVYGGDPRLLPIYSAYDVAHHLHLAPSTVRSWVRPPSGVIVPADGRGSLLSFQNLIEVHVLSLLRTHRISLQRLRAAVAFLREFTGSQHPLADVDLYTDRSDVFAVFFGLLISIAERPGQIAIRTVLARYLDRIERDHGQLQRLYPFVDDIQPERSVVIDPLRKSGMPYLVGVGVETFSIASRFKAGESVDVLARDFNATRAQIEGALRFERLLPEAA